MALTEKQRLALTAAISLSLGMGSGAGVNELVQDNVITLEQAEQFIQAEREKQKQQATHWAKVVDGEVVEVIVADYDFIQSGRVGDQSLWVPTFKNDDRLRYAGKGMRISTTTEIFDFKSKPIERRQETEPPVIVSPTSSTSTRL